MKRDVCAKLLFSIANLRACLRGGGAWGTPLRGTPGRWGNPLRWGNPPVHIISHFNLITFACLVGVPHLRGNRTQNVCFFAVAVAVVVAWQLLWSKDFAYHGNLCYLYLVKIHVSYRQNPRLSVWPPLVQPSRKLLSCIEVRPGWLGCIIQHWKKQFLHTFLV